MFISANETKGKNDSESIMLAIKKAKESGTNSVLIPRHNERTEEDVWVIEDTIYLPDDMEIIIDDAYMVLADNVYANMFANESVLSEEKRSISAEQKNIRYCYFGWERRQNRKEVARHKKRSRKA